MLGWSCIPESIINSSYDLKSFAVSVSLQQQDVTQRDNNEEHRITLKKGKPIYCGSLRKHPFLLALRCRGRFARRNVSDSATEIPY